MSASALDFDLATGTQTSTDPCASASPCPPVGNLPAGSDERVLYLAARYTECYSRPERVPAAGCGCDESACEYARIRDGFEVTVLFELPGSHRRAARLTRHGASRSSAGPGRRKPGPAPVPPCSGMPRRSLGSARAPSAFRRGGQLYRRILDRLRGAAVV